MNRLVLQQQTARSLTAAPNPLADRAADKLAGVGAASSRPQDISADRSASFAHTLDRKTKPALPPKDRPKQAERPVREPGSREKPASERAARTPKQAQTESVSQTEIEDTLQAGSEAQDEAGSAADPSGNPVDTAPIGTDADVPPEPSVDPNVPTQDVDSAVQAVSALPPDSSLLTTPAPVTHTEVSTSDAPSAQSTTTTTNPDAAAASSLAQTSSRPLEATTHGTGKENATPSTERSRVDAAAPRVTASSADSPPAVGPGDSTSTPVPANNAAPVAKAGKAASSQQSASASVRNASASRAQNQPEEASESQGADVQEAEAPEGETVAPAPAARSANRFSQALSESSGHSDSAVPQAAASTSPTASEPLLQPLAAASSPGKSQEGAEKPADPVVFTPSLAATSSRAMDLLGRLVSEPAASAANQASGSAQASPEFQRALQSQVQRGIEQAAQQAAAAGAWTGVGVGSSGSVTLRLHPANLGMMRVYLRMDTETGGRVGSGAGSSGGGVRARFEVSNTRTKGLLGSSIASLRTALESRGLSVTEVSVTDMTQMPERDVGWPPVAEVGGEDGAAFAENTSRQAFGLIGAEGLSSASGARAEASAETDGESDHGAADLRWEGGGRPVALAALATRSSPLSIGDDGRVSVNALV